MDRLHPVPVTPTLEANSDRPSAPRRPTVRIVERRTLSRNATLSLMLALAAATVAFAAWRWWRPEPAVAVYRRSISDVELSWRCEAGHTFSARGQTSDRPCAMCARPAYAVTAYECKTHGPIEVAVRFEADESGRSRVSHLRVHGGEWVPMETDPVCSKCDSPLTRETGDSFEPLTRGRKRGGG